jgi:hypothetical protein
MLGHGPFEFHAGPCEIDLGPAWNISAQMSFTRARVKFKLTLAERIRGSADYPSGVRRSVDDVPCWRFDVSLWAGPGHPV